MLNTLGNVYGIPYAITDFDRFKCSYQNSHTSDHTSRSPIRYSDHISDHISDILITQTESERKKRGTR